LGHDLAYFVKNKTKGISCHTENEAIWMLKFLIDNIFIEFGGDIFSTDHQHTNDNKWCSCPCRFFLLPCGRVYAKDKMITDKAKAFIGDLKVFCQSS
jgi:hypothetical protein